MGKVNIKIDNEITVKDIQAYMEGTVTKFGSGAKVDCPKEFLGKKAFLIIYLHWGQFNEKVNFRNFK